MVLSTRRNVSDVMAEFNYHRILIDPLVVALTSGKSELWPGVAYTGLVAVGRPAHVLISLDYYLEKHLPRIVDVMDAARSRFPNIRFIILASAEEEESLARSRGIDTLLCNHNCFLDERLIYPEFNVPKLYDAVYNGRLVPQKRYELAAHTPRLAVIASAYDVEKKYATKVLSAMLDVAYCNYDPASVVHRHLGQEQVRRILVQSHCGLALSAIEGAMYASGEYLLAGLPVVTTQSLGGRDVFFHPDYVITVDDNPEAVAAAVADFKRRSLDPVLIRNRTIALFREHRRRLVARLSEITQRDLFPLADHAMWLPQFKHRMRTRLKVNVDPTAESHV
jgi:glycosyltransferase involved in cell wall biosynthesis